MSKRFAKDNSKVFSIRLKQRMFEKDMTQAMLSDLTGLQRQTISLYQRGENVPAADNLAIIAETLECSTDWLLGLTDYTQKDIEGTTLESIGLSEKAARNLKSIMENDTISREMNFLLSSNYLQAILNMLNRYRSASIAMNIVLEADRRDLPLSKVTTDNEYVQRIIKAFEISRGNGETANIFNSAFGSWGSINPTAVIQHEISQLMGYLQGEIFEESEAEIKRIAEDQLGS